jgi:hypothetical protein
MSVECDLECGDRIWSAIFTFTAREEQWVPDVGGRPSARWEA